MERLIEKSKVREKFLEYGIDIFGNKVYDVINEILGDYRAELVQYLTLTKAEELGDFYDNSEDFELTDFQQGVLYGMELAKVKIKNAERWVD